MFITNDNNTRGLEISVVELAVEYTWLNCIIISLAYNIERCIPYSQKYWRELNLAVEPKIAIARILADLNLAVWYGIAIRIHASRKFWQIFLIWQL